MERDGSGHDMLEKMPRIKLGFIIIATIASIFCFKYTIAFDYENNIQKYLELLKNDPANCFYNEQVATSYQAINDFDEAIKYYEIAIRNCPNHLISIFQLGVCYFIKKEKNKGLELMEKAIQEANKINDRELEEMFKKEKSSWISKWEDIKKLNLEELRKRE